jgi:hypothetical protein
VKEKLKKAEIEEEEGEGDSLDVMTNGELSVSFSQTFSKELKSKGIQS